MIFHLEAPIEEDRIAFVETSLASLAFQAYHALEAYQVVHMVGRRYSRSHGGCGRKASSRAQERLPECCDRTLDDVGH